MLLCNKEPSVTKQTNCFVTPSFEERHHKPQLYFPKFTCPKCNCCALVTKSRRYTSKLVRYILFDKTRYVSLCSTRYDINPYYACRQAHIVTQAYRIVRYIANPKDLYRCGKATSAQLCASRKTVNECNLNIFFGDFTCKNHTVAFNTAESSGSKVCNNNNLFADKLFRFVPFCNT